MRVRIGVLTTIVILAGALLLANETLFDSAGPVFITLSPEELALKWRVLIARTQAAYFVKQPLQKLGSSDYSASIDQTSCGRRLSDNRAALRALGCSEFCFFREVLKLEGETLACVNFDGFGGAELAPRSVAEPCLWPLDPIHQGAAAVQLNFLRDAAPTNGVPGAALIGLADGINIPRDYTRRLASLLWIPVLSNTGRNDRGDLTVTPDMYYARSKGYKELNARTDAASVASPWERKPRTVAFRGSTTGPMPKTPEELSINPRLRLALLAKEHQQRKAGNKGSKRAAHDEPSWDVKVTKLVQVNPQVADAIASEELQASNKEFASLIKGARGLFDVDGNVNSWSGLWWKLRSNSVTIKVESGNKQWYYDDLKPWVHYVPVANNMSDLSSAVDFVLDRSNDNALKKIARASTRFIRNLTYAHETNKVRLSLEKCFTMGICSPEQEKRLTLSSSVTESSSEDTKFDAALTRALLKGIGSLVKKDPRLWSALEMAASCYLRNGS
jgi:hypothetical protein